MSYRAAKSGLAAEAQAKNAEKYDTGVAQQALQWIERRTGESFNTSGDVENVHEVLKNGMLLAKLMNSIVPGAVKIPSKAPTMPFKQMELVNFSLDAMEKIGLKRTDLFQTVDLTESVNMTQVVNTIHAVGRQANKMGQDGIGPKEATKNERSFSEDQLRQGQSIIGLQMGTNKGASQAGMNMGKSRKIMD